MCISFSILIWILSMHFCFFMFFFSLQIFFLHVLLIIELSLVVCEFSSLIFRASVSISTPFYFFLEQAISTFLYLAFFFYKWKNITMTNLYNNHFPTISTLLSCSMTSFGSWWFFFLVMSCGDMIHKVSFTKPLNSQNQLFMSVIHIYEKYIKYRLRNIDNYESILILIS